MVYFNEIRTPRLKHFKNYKFREEKTRTFYDPQIYRKTSATKWIFETTLYNIVCSRKSCFLDRTLLRK